MSTPDTQPAANETLTLCPLCGAQLDPVNPNACPKCDWVTGYRRSQATGGGTVRDRFAVVLSVVPGLGHIYKGHRVLGAMIMIGSAFAASAAVLAGAASAGWGILLIPLYWIGVMLHVYWLEDLIVPAPPRH